MKRNRCRCAHSLGVGVVACAFLTDAFALGARSFFPVVLEAWENDFGWSRSKVSAARGLMYLSQGLVTPLAGNVMDTFDPRMTLVGGLVGLAITLGLTSAIAYEWQMFLFFGVLA